MRTWTERGTRPGRRLEREWNGLNRRGDAVADGRYVFEVGPRGGRLRGAGRFRLHGHAFPVDGPHGTRGAIGEFGADRSGGRSHEGFDVTAECGTPLVATRGATSSRRATTRSSTATTCSIDGTKTGEELLLFAPDRTGDVRPRRPGPDGRGRRARRQTGNAASTPCHLHFEMRSDGRPVDPEPALRRWDAYS